MTTEPPPPRPAPTRPLPPRPAPTAAPRPPRLRAASAEPADYLAADEVIDHGHPEIRALAGRLRRDNPAESARAAFEHVRDRVAHSADLGRWSGAYRASDVLAAGDAICHGKAHLLTAVLRAQGIPAGLCYQRLDVLHAMVAAHWPQPAGGGAWVRLDPRGNKPGVDARFATDPAAERLAWPVDPARGEYWYDTVHPTTPDRLRTALAAAEPGRTGYGYYLPAEL
ncbi:transglutaminase family protein [Kitasatospora sp. NPDC088346]|uniref:transglutaminase-like domain-containing protein n=1 Tax=Kitasatospora sp. NPDC088346 TaxID=3364073 RepID=UPI0038022F94